MRDLPGNICLQSSHLKKSRVGLITISVEKKIECFCFQSHPAPKLLIAYELEMIH